MPQQAKLLREFVAEEELLPLCLAIGRVFAKYGEKKNRNTARLKFLINKIGIDEFKRRVAEERAALEPDPTLDRVSADICPIPTSSRFASPSFCRSRTPRTPSSRSGTTRTSTARDRRATRR